MRRRRGTRSRFRGGFFCCRRSGGADSLPLSRFIGPEYCAQPRRKIQDMPIRLTQEDATVAWPPPENWWTVRRISSPVSRSAKRSS